MQLSLHSWHGCDHGYGVAGLQFRHRDGQASSGCSTCVGVIIAGNESRSEVLIANLARQDTVHLGGLLALRSVRDTCTTDADSSMGVNSR